MLEHIDIEINHRCNLACRHCSARAVRGACLDELSIDEIKRILSEAKEIGLRKVGLTGGEPLYDLAKLETVARFCVEELDVPLHTHTNGTLVNGELYKNSNPLRLFESVSVTFLGPNAESHDYMTGVKGSFKKAREAAVSLADKGFPLTCYFIPTHGICDGFDRLMGELQSQGVNRIRIMALAPSGRARPIYGETAPEAGEVEVFQDRVVQTAKKLGVTIEAGYCTRTTMRKLGVLCGHEKCTSGLNRVHINYRGDVFPCTAASGVKELKLGNLRDNSLSISEIWQNSELLRRIRLLHSGKLEACSNCLQNPKCQYGCTVNTIGTMSDDAKQFCPLLNLNIEV